MPLFPILLTSISNAYSPWYFSQQPLAPDEYDDEEEEPVPDPVQVRPENNEVIQDGDIEEEEDFAAENPQEEIEIKPEDLENSRREERGDPMRVDESEKLQYDEGNDALEETEKDLQKAAPVVKLVVYLVV